MIIKGHKHHRRNFNGHGTVSNTAGPVRSIYNNVSVEQLANGATIVAREFPGMDTGIVVNLPYGLVDHIYESHMHEHLIYRSRPEGSKYSTDTLMERLSGVYTAYTYRDSMLLVVRVLSDNTNPALELLVNSLKRHDISNETIRKERNIIVGELKSSRSNPLSVIDNAVDQNVLEDTGLKLEEETIAGIMSVSLDDLSDSKKRYFGGRNLYVGIVGPNARNVLKYARKIVGELPNKGNNIHKFSIGEAKGVRKNYTRHNFEDCVVQLSTSIPGYSKGADINERVAIEVAANILAGTVEEYYSRARFWKVLRDRLGIAYSFNGECTFYSGVGTLDLGAMGISRKHFNIVRNRMLDEVEKLGRYSVSDSELSDAANSLSVSNMRYISGSVTNAAERIVELVKAGEDPSVVSYERVLESLTPSDIRYAVKKYLSPDRLFVATLKCT